MNPFKERTVAGLMIAGCLTCACSGTGTFIFGVLGIFGNGGELPNLSGLIWTLWTIGAILFVGGLGYGLFTHQNLHRGARATVPNARVLSRYAVTPDGLYLTDPLDIEVRSGERLQYCVRMQTGPRPTDTSEYSCQPAVFWQCGEGMYGEAELQGKWVGRFTPYIGERPAT